MTIGNDPTNPDYYTKLDPQPVDVIEAWGLGPHESMILKYLSRWRSKGGLNDLRKMRWWADRLIVFSMENDQVTKPDENADLTTVDARVAQKTRHRKPRWTSNL